MAAQFVLRPLDVSHDCDGVARVMSACVADWPVTGEEFKAQQALRPAGRPYFASVAVDANGICGYGFVTEPTMAARPGRLRIRVLVDPARRRLGAGGGLYSALLEIAREAGGTELVTEAAADEAGALAFLSQRGFVEYHRRVDSRLRLAEVDAPAIARGIDASTDAFFPAGVRIATYRQLQLACKDAPRRLYDLDATLWLDVPFGLSGSVPSFEEYQSLELGDPHFLPQATFVALAGDRWIGLGALMSGPGFLYNSMTGVVRDWRGRGLARWLKLHTIRCSLERKAPELRAFNDGGNEAILALNRSLGFRIASTELRYRKELQ